MEERLFVYKHCAGSKNNNLALWCPTNIDLIQKKNLNELLFLLFWQV